MGLPAIHTFGTLFSHLIEEDGNAPTYSCRHRMPPSAPRALPGQSKEAGEEWGDVISMLEWAPAENSLLVGEHISEAQLTKQEKCFAEINLLRLNSP